MTGRQVRAGTVAIGLAGALAGTAGARGQLAVGRQQQFVDCGTRARALLAEMTLDEKLGQMLQPDQSFLKDPNDIDRYHLGSLLSGGGSGPKDESKYTLAGWTDMVDSYQRVAMHTRLGIPLLYGVDAVHGHNNIPGATIFPHEIGLGCTRDPALVERVERVTAAEVRATGINWAFSPCVTVPQDERWGRTYEGFGEEPTLVAELGAAAVRGFQGANLSDPLSVLACAKHFAGDGGTSLHSNGKDRDPAGLDEGDTRADEATLRKIHLPGYPATVAAGVGSVMPSYNSWNGAKCSGSRFLLTDVLKREMGFDGFLISDYNAVDQLGPDYKQDVERSVNAGMDMIMLTDKYPELYADLHALVAEGKIPLSRVDDAVTRILRVKFAMGLMDRSPLADRSLWKEFGSAEHRAVARQAVRESMVLLKNQNGVLPLKKSSRILVAGKAADSLGLQCGGWTIGWQGDVNQPKVVGTTLLAGLREVAGKDAQITYIPDGIGGPAADVAVVVVGEQPYAEWLGDRMDLSLDQADAAVVANVKKLGIPLAMVVVSARPLILGATLDQADAVLAAWWPGSEGTGVADVLFGDAKPTAKLSRTWPRSNEQLSLTVNGPATRYDPLFKFGFGLTYPASR